MGIIIVIKNIKTSAQIFESKVEDLHGILKYYLQIKVITIFFVLKISFPYPAIPF